MLLNATRDGLDGPQAPASVTLKLEHLQVTGSFKIRGALNHALQLPESARAAGLATASGGNHGLGVACAARLLKIPALVVLPNSAPAAKVEALEAWGAEVIRHGAVWDEADAYARERAEERGMAYVHPFAHPHVIAGQGTLALELFADLARLDVLLVPIGGGGLIAGMATVAKQVAPETTVIGVEPVGAATLHNSLAAGRVVPLDRIESRVGSLAPICSDPLNFSLIQQYVDAVVLVTDQEIEDAQRWLWREAKISADLAAAATTAALLGNKHSAFAGARVGTLICGGGHAFAPTTSQTPGA